MATDILQTHRDKIEVIYGKLLQAINGCPATAPVRLGLFMATKSKLDELRGLLAGYVDDTEFKDKEEAAGILFKEAEGHIDRILQDMMGEEKFEEEFG